MQMLIAFAVKRMTFAVTFSDIYRKGYGKIAVILQRNLNFNIFTAMTDEEKRAQEEAAAQAAAAQQAGGEAGGAAGGEGAGEGGEGGNAGGEGGEGNVTPRDENGAPVAEPMPRDVFFERIRAKAPEGKYDEDEQEYYRQALALVDKLEEVDGRFNGLADKMLQRFKSSPEEAAAWLDYIDGKPLVAAIREYMGDEALTMKEGDEGWEAYQQANADRNRRMQEQQELIRAQIENANASATAFNEFVTEEKLNEDEARQLSELLLSDTNNISMGKHDKELLKRYLRFLRYDSDIQGAYEQGKADAQNAAIEAEQAHMQGSGLPGMSAGSAKEHEEEEKPEANGTATFLKGIRRR